VSVPIHRHLALLHGLEQARLRLRRRPVELVDEYHVCKYRSRPELEAAYLWPPDGRSHHVGREEINGGLYTRDLAVQAGRDRPGQLCLPNSGVVLDEQVTVRQQRGKHRVEHLGRHVYGGAQVGAQPVGEACDIRDSE
jgi:hypothetical protein